MSPWNFSGRPRNRARKEKGPIEEGNRGFLLADALFSVFVLATFAVSTFLLTSNVHKTLSHAAELKAQREFAEQALYDTLRRARTGTLPSWGMESSGEAKVRWAYARFECGNLVVSEKASAEFLVIEVEIGGKRLWFATEAK